MKKTTRIFKGIIGATLLVFNLIFSPVVFAQDKSNEQLQVEEVEEVEIPEDSIVIATPSDIALAPEDEAIPRIPADLMEDRLGCLQKNIKLTYNPVIRSFIEYFTVRNRHYTVVMERRKNIYFPIFEEMLKKHNMPDELKYLSIVESGLNPRAISRAGAAGLWQFMPGTGRDYKLYQDTYVDERLDPYKATEAACRYLKDLYNIFHDWELALASYNCGPGNVRKAIRQSGYKDSFWEIYRFLPQETRGYVPQFVAVVYAMNYLKEHKIVADSLQYPMEFETVQITSNMNIDKLCEQLNMCSEELQFLNPSLKKNIIPAHLNYNLRIPADKYLFFAENRLAIIDSCAKDCDKEISLISIKAPSTSSSGSSGQRKIIYTVKRGDNLGKIAGKYNVSTANIKKWNKMRSSTVKVGQRLVIYKKGTTRAASPQNEVVKNANHSPASKKTVAQSNSKPKVYMVQPGDTLWGISKKTNTSVEEIKRRNGLKGNEIKVGMKLILG